ncbi:BLUF domain-containing protein [Variovorax sp. RHLX14]|uniref:BLUF domain-containing protein n=1 Tax=Variovorax sp. RHLX14 TaxID=1259731 RepID=UPI003F488B31
MSELHEILYCSVLSPSEPPLVVGQIVGQARARNAERGITGLLVFDGSRFCQHIEGPPDAVDALMSRISHDPRHLDVRVLFSGQRLERRYKRFDLGFAQSEDPEDMAGVHELQGTQALERFLVLRPGFDING